MKSSRESAVAPYGSSAARSPGIGQRRIELDGLSQNINGADVGEHNGMDLDLRVFNGSVATSALQVAVASDKETKPDGRVA